MLKNDPGWSATGQIREICHPSALLEWPYQDKCQLLVTFRAFYLPHISSDKSTPNIDNDSKQSLLLRPCSVQKNECTARKPPCLDWLINKGKKILVPNITKTLQHFDAQT